MDKDRTMICNIISEMLDNPDENGIYSTTKAYDALEKYIEGVRAEAIGWTYADACISLDNKKDYRKIEPSSILERAMRNLA